VEFLFVVLFTRWDVMLKRQFSLRRLDSHALRNTRPAVQRESGAAKWGCVLSSVTFQELVMR